MNPHLTGEYLGWVNELVPKAAPMGAYCVGAVSASAWQSGLKPTRELLRAASLCETTEAADRLFEDWKARRAP
jgi:hypothetical protein